ncbi:Calcium/calmodulin-dependent protein kinase type 1 (CaM kinase I) (MnCaMKI), partial [Durusdinium trenchii]
SVRSIFKAPAKEAGEGGDAGPQEAFEDRFEVGNLLGKGNFSEVKTATDKKTGEVLAVKIMKKRKITREEYEAIMSEIAILADMDHPNVIKMHGMWEDKNHVYVVTELAKGGELFDRIVQREFYSEKDAAVVVKTVAEALKYLNDRGIVHRDLKPENILLVDDDDDSALKLADFGFAKQVDATNEDTLATTCGTPGYVAPEIISGKPYGKEVDMWSLGVITYILLAGYPPFYDENQNTLFRQIKKAKYKFDPEFWSEVSESAKDLIRGLLVVDPKKRLTVDQVLAHPWVANAGGDDGDKDITPALTELKKFQARKKLRKGFHAVVAMNKFKNLASLAASQIEKEAAEEEDAEEEDAEEEEN